jgi:hypothetical protein
MNNTINDDISKQIKNILDNNQLEDLKEFIDKRKCLNSTNMSLIYLFHIIQSAGILTTTIATGYNYKELIWVGIGLNLVASLINTFEHLNNSMSKRLLKDIIAIKDNTYVGASEIVDPEKDNQSSNTVTLAKGINIDQIIADYQANNEKDKKDKINNETFHL